MNARLLLELLALALLFVVSALVLWMTRPRDDDDDDGDVHGQRGTSGERDEPRVLAVDLSKREPPA